MAKSTGVAFESTDKVACFEFPDFDGTVLGGGSKFSVRWMEGERCNVGFMTPQFEFGRSLGQV